MIKKLKTIDEMIDKAVIPKHEQPYNIPGNWVWIELGNNFALCLDKYRKPVNASERSKRIGEVPYYGATGQVGWIDDFLTNEELVILGEDGAPFLDPTKNKAYMIDGKAWVNNHAHILKSNFGKNGNKFLYYYLNQFNFNNYVSGTTRLKLTQSKMNQIPIPLPPLNEQQRIAEKLERLLDKVNQAMRLIEEVKETFELRRAAIIKSILEDGLVNNQLTEGWKKIEVKSLFNIFGGGTPSKTKDNYWNGNIPWISPKDMKTRYISETIDYITEEGLENSSAKLAKKNSVVMVVRSGILQRTLPVGYLLRDSTVNQDIKVFDSGNEIINKFFMWYLIANEQFILNNYSKSGTTVDSIEFEKFKSHELYLPPMDLLNNKIEKIDSLLKKENEVGEIIDLSFNLNKLKSSILSKAFRGELGTNDSSEESAIELLKSVLQEQLS